MEHACGLVGFPGMWRWIFFRWSYAFGVIRALSGRSPPLIGIVALHRLRSGPQCAEAKLVPQPASARSSNPTHEERAMLEKASLLKIAMAAVFAASLAALPLTLSAQETTEPATKSDPASKAKKK